jgi:hypothetical protein
MADDIGERFIDRTGYGTTVGRRKAEDFREAF